MHVTRRSHEQETPSLSLRLRRMVTDAGGGVFHSCCVSGARARDGAQQRISPTIPVVLDPPAQSAVPFPRVPFECEIDPVCGNAVMEVLGSFKLSQSKTQYLEGSFEWSGARNQKWNHGSAFGSGFRSFWKEWNQKWNLVSTSEASIANEERSLRQFTRTAFGRRFDRHTGFFL